MTTLSLLLVFRLVSQHPWAGLVHTTASKCYSSRVGRQYEPEDHTNLGKQITLILGQNPQGPSGDGGSGAPQMQAEVGAWSVRDFQVSHSAFYCHHMLEILNAVGNKRLPPPCTVPSHQAPS